MINRTNYLRVNNHIQFLREVYQIVQSSADRYRFHLRLLLLWLDDQPLARAPQIRPTFPVFVSQLPGKDGIPMLALESQITILECARRFFLWAKTEYGEELEDLSQAWIETIRLAPSAPERARPHVYVTEDEIRKLMQAPIPAGDLALRRDRAAAAMLFISGARAAAFVTLPIRAVRIQEYCIDQFPSLGVQTKKNKTATTYLLQIPELLNVVREWDELVRTTLPPTAPWYAVVESSWGDQKLVNQAPGENRAGGLDKRLKRLYALADMPYHSAHKFRHGHAIFGLLRARTPADVKAVSQNLMHASTRITDEVYSFLSEDEVKERILSLGKAPASTHNPEMEDLIRKSIQEEMQRGLEKFGRMLGSDPEPSEE